MSCRPGITAVGMGISNVVNRSRPDRHVYLGSNPCAKKLTVRPGFMIPMPCFTGCWFQAINILQVGSSYVPGSKHGIRFMVIHPIMGILVMVI